MLLTKKGPPHTEATNRLFNLLIKHLVLDVFAQYVNPVGLSSVGHGCPS